MEASCQTRLTVVHGVKTQKTLIWHYCYYVVVCFHFQPTMGISMIGKKPSRRILSSSPSPVSPPPDYPGLEYPPVFEPETYTLSDASSLLRSRQQSHANVKQRTTQSHTKITQNWVRNTATVTIVLLYFDYCLHFSVICFKHILIIAVRGVNRQPVTRNQMVT
jgi:hypothetical protein